LTLPAGGDAGDAGARPRRGDLIEIVYRRPPDRVQTFRQLLVDSGDAGVVTYLDAAEVPEPVRDDAGRVILEPGAPIVWLTFPGAWHDIGRFHLADGTFTGLYANVLTPVAMDGLRWETTDLFLDVWLAREAPTPSILDRDELDQAEREGWLDTGTADRARQEAQRLLGLHADRAWPPPIAGDWTLARTRAALAGGAPPPND
jgi:predicted RNA-binding protein associated with RNAse of E/G family